jgi:hypothetical protein
MTLSIPTQRQARRLAAFSLYFDRAINGSQSFMLSGVCRAHGNVGKGGRMQLRSASAVGDSGGSSKDCSAKPDASSDFFAHHH